MNEADAIDMVTAVIWTVLIASGPAVFAAMSIGIIIALFQAVNTSAGNDSDIYSKNHYYFSNFSTDSSIYRGGRFMRSRN
ncbi:flagellar biosynthesis protein FliQ [Bartonella bovis m02]|uniref:Flagellar biosynthesis protein FliQ n=1 Tax=Bartonella bovis m02 TaxID=1094492 RepID=N6V7T3_9HYPH|nr:flagellar biosynthesis protein FliQ [Bartonella bovis m02]